MGYIYLASPYTCYKSDGSWDEYVMEERYKCAIKAAASLIKSGFTVFCPIAMSHEIDKVLGRQDPTHWYEFDRTFVALADAVVILKLPGWEESVGIHSEIALARKLEKLVLYIDPTEDICD